MKRHPVASAALLFLLIPACAAPTAGSRVSDAEPGSVAYDRDVFQTLLGSHELIRREVKEIPNGIEAVTESDNAEVAELIQDHVAAMKVRIENGYRLRQWDPIFVAIFDHADKIRMEYEKTPKGMKVREVSDDPYVARLIQAHAKMVSGFAARGVEESKLAHEPPAR
jgi:hypothetical protein